MRNDPIIARIVSAGLVLTTLGGIASTTLLLVKGVDASAVALVSGVTGTAAGALASLLSSTRTISGS